MSLNNVPSKAEVTGWSPQSLADYMSRLKLSGCDKVVMKGNITGAGFIQMTERDLQLFPCLYVPIITKIQSDINKSGQKQVFDKFKAQKYPKQVIVQEEEHWDSDEYDNNSDENCEGPYQEETEDGYISALTEPQTAEQQDTGEPCKEIYRKPPRHQHRAPASQPTLHIDRSNKPGQPVPTQRDITKSKGGAVKAPGSSACKIPTVRTHKPTDVSNRGEKRSPAPPVATQLTKVNNSTSGTRKDLDPSWYGGNITRHQAEVVLREVNEDGAFVVRDSTKGSDEHPYTLMLLKEGKVYNIKICNQGNSYFLGTGFNTTKSFPGVKEMITHHAHTPLLLIDATDHSSKAQSQCCLLYPVGL
ncbi:lymphocyte cytosolic protein 2 [Pempheris klunzingeri]|uniref:lymphocyte cytosolic protein 2 n=1 Tax=Pempheris klunzingeri TaxID=3127111 RepID=UPI0039808B20